MDRVELIERLRALRPELGPLGVTGLSLFGSRARGDQRFLADVDIAFTVEARRPFSLLDYSGLQVLLKERLGLPVDIVREPARNAALQSEIDRDRIRAY